MPRSHISLLSSYRPVRRHQGSLQPWDEHLHLHLLPPGSCHYPAALLLPLAIILERKNAPPMSIRLFAKLFLYALLGNTISFNLYNTGLEYTSSTVASAAASSVPVLTFFFAVLLRLEVIRLRRLSGVAKVAGVGLCLGGVLVIALYSGPALSPLNHHRAFGGGAESGSSGAATRTRTRARWVTGTLLMLLSNVTWSLWIVLMSPLLNEYPCKMLATPPRRCSPCSARRSRWCSRRRLDAGLLAVAYSAVAVTGVSYYLQAWCIQKKGPVFLAMSSPLSFVFTIFCSSFFLGEIVHLGSVVGGLRRSKTY
uniref:WAT1-related protein n=1 Tax=Oryza meridionalis TaxID=40149 RepID=A0A0E0BYV8_9ORYZ